MQIDMHYYGTYAMARAAGIPKEDAHIIATSAQFVDDSTKDDSAEHSDLGLLYGIATAHSNAQCVANALIKRNEQRRVWVPFHFLPGGRGENLQEKLLCQKDSSIAQEMMDFYISIAPQKQFRLELLGIAAHVYMDTFSHYGFSGLSSDYNAVVDGSIKPIGVKNPKMERYVLDKMGKFIEKFGFRKAMSFFAETTTDCLGHGAVATFPDRPYLEWTFEYTLSRSNNEKVSHRNNRETFLEGCRKLHKYFSDFATTYYTNSTNIPFAEIENAVQRIIKFEGTKEKRSDQWKLLYFVEADIKYMPELWEEDKKNMGDLVSSDLMLAKPIYRFHQAAAYHRYYVLKDLLPAHGIAVY